MPPLDDSKQRPLFDVRQFVPQPYPAGSFYDVLERYSGAIIQRRDFPDPGPDFGGQTRWCPVLLSKLVLIQAKHGWRDRETVQRGCTDLQVKACLGLGVEQEGPSQPTLCRHRQLMADLGLDEVYEQRWSALMLALGLLERDEAVLVDSVPVHGAGQVLDTYNLLGAAIRKSLRALARAHGQSETRVAGELDLARYLDRNVKGSFDIDWDDPQARLALLDQLVTDAQRVEEALRSLASDVTRQPAEQAPSPAAEETEADQACLFGGDLDPPPDDAGGASAGPTPTPPASSGDDRGPQAAEALDEAAKLVHDILDHDVAFDADGAVTGIVPRAAGDRPISATDTDMRHGRKSASVLIAGFKPR